MKILFRQTPRPGATEEAKEDLSIPSLKEDIEKTRLALEIAYAGFDNATDPDMIDCYIFEINSLLKRYKHLSELCDREAKAINPLSEHAAVCTPVGEFLG